jgi:cytoskeletal protein CcmA (bactofilin family)
MPLIDKIREKKLIELAKTRFDPDLKPAELKVLHDSASSEEVPWPAEKAPRPVVRSEFLRWLAIDSETAPHIDPKGLRVYGATIPGALDLRECHVNPTLTFYLCNFQGEFNLRSAETRGLFFFDSSLAGDILADRVIVHGPLSFNRIQSDRKIVLVGAKIEGSLECNGAKLKAKGSALNADSAKIGGYVFLKDGFESEGEISLRGAEITEQLNCVGAKLKASPSALLADGSKIGGGVMLILGFESEGTIRLAGAEIGGNLEVIGARVSEVVFENAVVKGDLLWQRIERPEDTALNLIGAKVKILRDDRKSWPKEGRLYIDGFVYEGLQLHEPASDEKIKIRRNGRELPLKAKDRIAWLELQPQGDVAAQPWVQLAGLLKASGDSEGAREVLYEYRRRSHGRNLLLRARTYPFDRLEQQPLKISALIASLGLVGWYIFWRADRMRMMAPTEKEAYEEFHQTGKPPARYAVFDPIIYSLENVLPVVKLGQDSAWAPDPQAAPGSWLPEWAKRWALARRVPQLTYRRLAASRWLLILLGWILAIILASAISDIFKP